MCVNWYVNAGMSYIREVCQKMFSIKDSHFIFISHFVLSITGDVLDEVHIKWSDWLSQAMRFYKDNPYFLELEWLVGPIPIE